MLKLNLISKVKRKKTDMTAWQIDSTKVKTSFPKSKRFLQNSRRSLIFFKNELNL